MTPTFDKICEDILNENNVDEKSKGLWHNMNKAKKRGKVSSKWKNDPKYRKQMKKQAKKISSEKSVHDPVRPGILKRQTKGKLTCTKARSLKSKQKNKGNNTAKAAQRYLNYHCDSVETEAKCTKSTKKASSTSKGKKWMKCVKNPDGKGYKRIHWGQKGVKVSGKANTKRRKSFRARHKCSSAKPGTAKYQACKDW